MKDTTCIKMPDNLYDFLKVLPVVQDYQLQLSVDSPMNRERAKHWQLTIRMDEKFAYLVPCLKMLEGYTPIIDYSGWDEEQRGEFDSFIRFDSAFMARAMTLASRVGFGFIMGLNSLIGTGAGTYPILKALNLPVPEEDILILDWNSIESEKFYEYLTQNHSDMNMILDPRNLDEFSVQEIIEYINHFKIIIGPRSTALFLSGSFRKPAIEIFGSVKEGEMFGDMSRPNYCALSGGNRVTAKFMQQVWEGKLWASLVKERLSKTKSQEEQPVTDSPESIAENVQEKSIVQ